MLDPNNRESNEQVENTEMEAEETSGFLDDENNSGKVFEISDFSNRKLLRLFHFWQFEKHLQKISMKRESTSQKLSLYILRNGFSQSLATREISDLFDLNN